MNPAQRKRFARKATGLFLTICLALCPRHFVLHHCKRGGTHQNMDNNLIPCIECGRPVSPSAESCPNCHAHDPIGVRCTICNQRLKQQDALPVYMPNDYPTFCHRSCLNEHFAYPTPISCPDCGQEFRATPDLLCDKRERDRFRCQYCGCRDPLSDFASEPFPGCDEVEIGNYCVLQRPHQSRYLLLLSSTILHVSKALWGHY